MFINFLHKMKTHNGGDCALKYEIYFWGLHKFIFFVSDHEISEKAKTRK